MTVYWGKLFWATLPVFAKRSHRPPLHREGKFVVCSVWYFIAEIWSNNLFNNLSVSCADSSLYQREPCNSFGLKCWFTAKQFYQREPILRFFVGYLCFSQLDYTTKNDCKRLFSEFLQSSFLDCFFTAPLFNRSQLFVSLINFKKPIYSFLFLCTKQKK